ncbi:hypothetical protein VDG1235_3793 [Verrucomicrobiia bacterium DG1235]|nr:hypothetical protein VDG1235_3793 [Verrucomicrobiae bacterium DG1235]
MTQSDSPDFEFDISDLEVEGDEASASKQGETMSSEKGSDPVGKPLQVPEEEALKDNFVDEENVDDEALSGFAIDDLPAAAETDVSASQSSDSETVESGSAADGEMEESSSAPVEPVSRIEKKKEPKPSRALGDDDLGADVFAEIDSDGESISFEDVIDDLMDEVEDFEAGGFVELDEEDSEAGSESDESGIFKMDDPDDSLSKSVDSNAVEDVEEEPRESAPAFPSPPADFEIPADPEPAADPESDSVEELPIEDAVAPDEVEIESEREESEVVADSKQDPVVDDATGVAPDFSDFEIPADPEVQVEPQEASIEEESDEPIAETEGVPEDLPEEESEPVEGHEKVLFSAEDEPVASENEAEESDAVIDEESVSDEVEDEEDISELVAAVADSEDEIISDDISSEMEPDASVEEISEEASASDGEMAEATASENEPVQEVENEVISDSEEANPGLSDADEEEENISELVAAASSAEDDAVEQEDGKATIEDEAETSDVADEDELNSEPEEEAAVADLDEEAISGLSEVEEEEEDISELVAAAVEDDSEEISEDAAEAIEDQSTEAIEDDDEEEIVDLPSADDLKPDDGEASSAEESAIPGLTEVPEDLDEEDISALLSSMGDESASEESESILGDAPELAVIDDDDDEIEASISEDDTTESTETLEDEVESADSSMPSAEELLMKAGGLLNADAEKPVDGASALLDVLDDDDEEEIVAMPSPESLISDAEEDDDEDVVAMPDPATMMAEASEGGEAVEESDSTSGNIADHPGDLPPPPPAPVEIIDDDPPEEDSQPEEPVAEVAAVPEESPDEGEIQDPFAGDLSLDDFDENIGELTDSDAAELPGSEESEQEEAAENGEEQVAAAEAKPAAVAEMPKPSLIWRVTHSMAVAAGLVLIGTASILAIWKQQIVEYYEGRDIDGSALIHEIESIGTHALSEFDEQGLYRMQWVDSEVRRVSENEIRLHALVGAQLRENLYTPVLESELKERMDYDEQGLVDSLSYAHRHFPEEIGHYPDKPWDSLYQISAAKDEILSLRVTYGLTRESKESDWELSRIKVSGYKEELKWPEGEPKYAFGENAYDIDSLEFANVFSEYKSDATAYVAKIDRLRSDIEAGQMALKIENDKQRERVKMALAEGAYFSGVAILGEDAVASRDVQLVITEVRDEGAFVKGVVRMDEESSERSKHFVGSLDFETTLSGKEQGVLSLRTVSMDSAEAMASDSPFFEPGSVSRMRLRADGFRLEGDSRDLSFRLTRSL